MEEKKVCVICSIGEVRKIKEDDKGGPLYYYNCNNCGCDYADAELVNLNKAERLKWEKSQKKD